jgi:tyrosine-protein kinase Etk/Wzc
MHTTNYTNHSPVSEDSFDIRKMLLKCRPYWYILLLGLALGVAGAFVINSLREPVYLVNSMLLIHESRANMPFMRDTDIPNNQGNVYNQITILESQTMIDSVLANMDVAISYYEAGNVLGLYPRNEIYKNAPFRVSFDENHPQLYGEIFTISIIDENSYMLSKVKGINDFNENKQYFFGQKLQGEEYSFTINMFEPFIEERHIGKLYQFMINDMSRLSRAYKGSLLVEPHFPESSVFLISFKATNWQRATDFVNTLTNTFIQQNLQQKNHFAQNTVFFIENQIALAAGNLEDTEGRLQNFREREQLIDINSLSAQLIDEVNALDRERSIVEVRQGYYNFLLEYVSDRRDFSEVFGPSALGIDDPMLNSLLVDLTKLHTERGRLLLSTTDRSPAVQAIDQNIVQIKAVLEENIKNIQAASDILITDLNRRIRRLEQRINQLPGTERELIGLQRMYNITDATYNFLLEKQAESGIALASNMPDHKIIDSARYVKAVTPRKTMNYALGFLLGLGVPFTFIFLRDFFNTRIVNKDQIERNLNFPIIGILPRHKPLANKGEIDVVIFDNPFSPVTEAFRNIRSNLHFFSPQKKNNLMVVTSTRSGEGKTFTAINLAAVLAMAGKRTLYIDADIRKIQPNKFTKNMLDIGLSNYLTGQARLEDVINPCGYNENMYIMNSGIISPNPAELLESQGSMRMLTEELNDYEYIIVDTAPVGMVADAKPLISKARLNIFVLRHNYSQHDDMEFIKDYSFKAGLKNVVIVINDIKQTRKGYGYGYGFGYGFGYGADSKKIKELVDNQASTSY